MSLNEEVEVLRRIPLFANIDPSKLKLLAFTSERVSYDEGESLFSQGDDGDAAYILIQGEADVIIDTDNGPLVVSRMQQHSIVGEIAILCDVPRTATVKAACPLITLKISKDLFFRLVSEFPQMAVEIMRHLANRLEQTTAHLRKSA